MELLEKGLIQVATWNEAVEELIADMEYCDIVCAYNACFDFKKAILYFEKTAEIDKPSKIYLEKCNFYIQNPPENWQGVWTAETK